MADLPKKRVSPLQEPLIVASNEEEAAIKAQPQPKTTTKKPATKKTTATKVATKLKIDAKTGSVKKTTSTKTNSKSNAKTQPKIKRPLTQAPSKPSKDKIIENTPIIVTSEGTLIAKEPPKVNKAIKKNKPVNVTTSKKGIKTIEPAPKEPEVIIRPVPKKTKALTKEEKVLYKKLEDAFDYVANLTWVIEERTMDVKNIPDLTLGELHVIEMVNKNNNKPMTLIANKLKVTVGSLTTGVNRLVQKEYLLRTRDEMDHRIILLSVTPKAKKVLKFHDKFHETILGLALDGVTLAQAAKVMMQFASVLELYYNPQGEVKKSKKEKK